MATATNPKTYSNQNDSGSQFLETTIESHRYGDLQVLGHMSLSLRKGESIAIVAPSGSGKSTLLRLFLRLEEPSEGKCLLNIPTHEIGVVFQEDNLLPWLDLEDNSLLINRLNDRDVSSIEVTKHLQMLGLDRFRRSFPKELSGGMKQKVALCRLLLHCPILYVIDEGMANIDDYQRFRLCDEFRDRVTKQGASLITITHNLTDALHLADRIILGTARPMRIVKEFMNPLPKTRNFTVRFTEQFRSVLEDLQLCLEQR